MLSIIYIMCRMERVRQHLFTLGIVLNFTVSSSVSLAFYVFGQLLAVVLSGRSVGGGSGDQSKI